jgi:hypothetical protein
MEFYINIRGRGRKKGMRDRKISMGEFWSMMENFG